MGIRQVALVVSSVALVAVFSSCGGGDAADSNATGATVAPTSAAIETTVAAPSTTTPLADTTLPPVDTTAAPTTVASAPELVALAPETDGERAALTAASTDEGRRRATGKLDGTEMAVGDPFLAGYVVFFSDGVTGYQVSVLNGALATYFGPHTDIMVTGTDYGTATMPAQSPRQQEAVAIGLAEIVATNPAAVTGGVLEYKVYFPKLAESVEPGFSGNYPHVGIFANELYGTYAQGGPEIR